MAHAWKACWVQALGGSNPPSSASSTSTNAGPAHHGRARRRRTISLADRIASAQIRPPTHPPAVRHRRGRCPVTCWYRAAIAVVDQPITHHRPLRYTRNEQHGGGRVPGIGRVCGRSDPDVLPLQARYGSCGAPGSPSPGRCPRPPPLMAPRHPMGRASEPEHERVESVGGHPTPAAMRSDSISPAAIRGLHQGPADAEADSCQ
jgi:hypothetical protein